MAVKLADAIVFLSTDDKKFTDGMKRASRDVDKLGDKAETTGSKLSGMFRGGVGRAMAWAGGLYSVGQAARYVYDEITGDENALAQVTAALKSTGGAAGVTAADIDSLTQSLVNYTTYSDDTIMSASALMLTFTNLSSNVFGRAMAAAADMSVALGVDLNSAVQTLGRSLNDPAYGMTLLSRSGIRLSESQKELVQSLMETGDMLGAQNVLLQEIETRYGGSAPAAVNTLAGQITQLSKAFSDLAGNASMAQGVVTTVIAAITDSLKVLNDKTFWEGFTPSGVMGVVKDLFRGTYIGAKDKEVAAAKARNEQAKAKQMAESPGGIMTAEGITQAEYDNKYYDIAAAEEAARATAEAARATEAARIKGLEMTPADKSRMAYRSMLQAQMAGTPEYGPQTMEESAESAASQYRGYSHRAAQRMRQPQRGGPRVVISHANFTAGPDQIRAYNQRRAMMPGF